MKLLRTRPDAILPPQGDVGITRLFGFDQSTNDIHICRSCPVSRADYFVLDNTPPVNDVCLWKLERAVKPCNRSSGIQQSKKTQSVSLHELGNSTRPALIHAHRKDFKISGTGQPIQLFERRHFLYAGRTPRGPEMHHHNFAPEIREAHRSSVQGLKTEFRCPVTLVDYLYASRSFFREEKKKKQSGSSNEDNQQYVFLRNRNHGPCSR